MKRFLVWTKKVMAYCGSAKTALNSFIEYSDKDTYDLENLLVID